MRGKSSGTESLAPPHLNPLPAGERKRVGDFQVKNICALVLCGGKGKRLRAVVRNRPKPMALVNGKPFLDYVLEHVKSCGIKDIVLLTGYKSGIIQNYYAKNGVRILKEKTPLGTAGAIRNAAPHIGSYTFFILNGDSLCRADLGKMLKFHRVKKAGVTIALARQKQVADYGSVKRQPSGRITSFAEKRTQAAPGIVNAGIYLFDKRILSRIPAGKKYSLELDVFPKVKNCYGYLSGQPLLDIGTPERLQKAQAFLLSRLKNAPHPNLLPKGEKG